MLSQLGHGLPVLGGDVSGDDDGLVNAQAPRCEQLDGVGQLVAAPGQSDEFAGSGGGQGGADDQPVLRGTDAGFGPGVVAQGVGGDVDQVGVGSGQDGAHHGQARMEVVDRLHARLSGSAVHVHHHT